MDEWARRELQRHCTEMRERMQHHTTERSTEYIPISSNSKFKYEFSICDLYKSNVLFPCVRSIAAKEP